MDKKKRQRSENWNSQEKNILLELIKEKIDVIEDKKIDTNTSFKKRDAWNDICKSFNKVSNVQRTMSQMQFQWRNTKMRLKAQDSAYKRECQKTGGGPKPESPSPEDLGIMSLIPLEFEVDFNKFDNDNGDLDDQSLIAYSTEANFYEYVDDPSKKAPLPVPEKAKQMKTHTVHSPEGANSNNSSADRTPLLKPRRALKRKNTTSCECDDKYKTELFLLTKGNLIEEHAEKMKSISMIRDLRLKCIKEEHEAAMKCFT